MTAVKKKPAFTEGKLFGKILLFVLPIIATNLLQTLYNAADMMVVSLSSEVNAVGAVGTTGAFINLIVHIFIGFSVGANVVVARHIGAGDTERARSASHTALLVGLFFGLACGGIGAAFSRSVLKGMGNTGNLLDLAVEYTYYYFAGVPFAALTNYLIAIFRAKGDSKTPLIVLALTGLLNVGLNLFFVLVLDMSVEGVALATSIANLVSFVVLLRILAGDKDGLAFSFKQLKPNKKELKNIVYIGFPSALQSTLFCISNMLIQSSVVQVNNALSPVGSKYQPVVSGTSAASNLSNFVYTAQTAISQGALTFTSQNIGAKKPKRVFSIMGCCCVIVSVLGLVLGGIIFLCKNPLLALYGIVAGEAGSLEEIAMSAATTHLLFVNLPYFLCGIMDVGAYVLRGLGKSVSSMVISLVGSCLLRVVWLLTVFPAYPTLEIVYVCYPITWALTATVQHTCAVLVLKRKIKAEERAAQC